MNERCFFPVKSDLSGVKHEVRPEFAPVLEVINACKTRLLESQADYLADLEFLKLLCIQQAKWLKKRDACLVVGDAVKAFSQDNVKVALKVVGEEVETEIGLRLGYLSGLAEKDEAVRRFRQPCSLKAVTTGLEELYKATDRAKDSLVAQISTINLRLAAISASITHGLIDIPNAVARLGEILSSTYLVTAFPDETLAYMQAILRDNTPESTLVGDFSLTLLPESVSRIISVPSGWLAINAEVLVGKTPDKVLSVRARDVDGLFCEWMDVGTSWKSENLLGAGVSLGESNREIQFLVEPDTAVAVFAMSPAPITVCNQEEELVSNGGIWDDFGGHYSSLPEE